MSRDPPIQKKTPDGSSTPNNISTPPPMQPPLPPSVTAPPANGKLSESSPLLQALPRTSNLSSSPFPENDDEFDEWTMPHRSSIYLIGLTLLMAGIQISWSVELAYISPYLLSLGLPKSTLSLVWMAGPFSGVIVQPLVGMMSDRCKFKWGRRRIFIVCSTIGVVLGFWGMGRTRSIVRWWTGRHDWESTRHAVIILAVASLIVLDLAINASIALP